MTPTAHYGTFEKIFSLKVTETAAFQFDFPRSVKKVKVAHTRLPSVGFRS